MNKTNRLISTLDRKAVVKGVLISAVSLGCLLMMRPPEGWFAAASVAAPAKSTAVAPEPSSQQEERTEFELVKITRFGFEPREIERSRGAFVLAVHNFSHQPDLVLQLHRVQGHRLREFRMARGRTRWQVPLSLPPGDYVLTEASNPEWRCHIRINS